MGGSICGPVSQVVTTVSHHSCYKRFIFASPQRLRRLFFPQSHWMLLITFPCSLAQASRAVALSWITRTRSYFRGPFLSLDMFRRLFSLSNGNRQGSLDESFSVQDGIHVFASTTHLLGLGVILSGIPLGSLLCGTRPCCRSFLRFLGRHLGI